MEEIKSQTEPMMRPGMRSETAMLTPGMEGAPSAPPPQTSSPMASAMTVPSDHAAPSLSITTGTAAGASAWQNNKKLTALWLNHQPRNSWIGVDGIGWRKLAATNDSSSVAFTMLSAHAREKGSAVNYREESDNMIYEMYVW